ncbi:MAG: dipeptidase PepE, partial [Rhizonema sp. PD38]|nr:dipeptidase PepE [Rhizonema sp. PD38]
TSTYEEYTDQVGNVFKYIGYNTDKINLSENYQELLKNAEAIVIGGGNTFHLVHWLHKTDIIETIRQKVENGTPYIGWSAGANVACPTIKTTNDMPIIEPVSFQALNLVPFQINPHYTDETIPNHNGETREARIREFLVLNPTVNVVGLKEETMLRVEGASVKLIGDKTMCLFKFNNPVVEYNFTTNLDFIIKE